MAGMTWRGVAGAVPGATPGALGGCDSAAQPSADSHAGHSPSSRAAPSTTAAPAHTTPAVADGLPGMPPVPDAGNVYADAGAGMLSPVARAARALVYVPHNSGQV